MIKAMLFDMDGVLIDSHDAWFNLFNKALEKFENRQVTKEEFDNCIWAKSFDKVCGKYFEMPTVELREYYGNEYDNLRKDLKEMDGANKTLAKLKGIKLVVVSNTQNDLCSEILKDLGLLKYFDLILGGDEVENGKPAPDILYKALEMLKLEKEEVLFIGDTVWDKMAAEKAGIKFIGFGIDGDIKVNELKEVVKYVS